MSNGDVRVFGVLDGVEIQEITLRTAAGAEVRVLTYGAVVRDIVVPSRGGAQRVCLGLNSIADYHAHSPYFGAVPGRFANRIAGGRFSLEGQTYQLPLNDGGVNCLHGGTLGFGRQPWTLESATATSVTLSLVSANGDEGFPGAMRATCTYSLIEPCTLRYELRATTDAPTVVNLTNHTYFNLDGSADVRDHEVTLFASHITPTDDVLIPTGAIAPVAGTAFDFRTPRSIRNPGGTTYDINYVLDQAGGQAPSGSLDHAAHVHSAKSGVTLDVFTNQPGVQFYDAAKLDCSVPGLGGARYGAHAGFCLETQRFPDAPNQPAFPSSVLRPDEDYENVTEFRFS